MAARCTVVFLALSCSVHAQVGSESYRNLVQNWLNDARQLVTSNGRANSDMAAAHSKLEHKLPSEIRRSSAWVSLQQDQTKFENGFHAFVRALQKGITTDEQYVRQLNRSGGIEVDSAEENLKARIVFQQALTQASGQFVQALKQIGDTLQSLPQPVTALSEFHQMTRTRDTLSGLLEILMKQSRARADEYTAMNRRLVAASTSTYTIPFGATGALLLEYTITTRTEYGMFRNKIAGTITNTAALPIHCTAVEPSSSGGIVSALLGFNVRIPPRGSQSFSQEDLASTINLRASGVSAWKASCTTPLSYDFVEGTVAKGFPGGTVTGSMGRTQIGITVENNSNEPIEDCVE